MRLTRLRVTNLRNVESVEIEPATGLTVLAGRNGSGKTTLLEAIQLLGIGRSFRSRRRVDLVRRGHASLIVHGSLAVDGGSSVSIGVEQGVEGTRLRVDGREVRSAAVLARMFPQALVTPDSQRLLSDGAELRRRLLDWALFHVEQGYGAVHQRYRRALRQRTAALRESGAPLSLQSWNEELAVAGQALHEARGRLVSRALPSISARIGELLDKAVEIEYRAGWDVSRPLLEVLQTASAEDRLRGYGADGPHRADLRFTVEGRPAQNVLSRGESKLFVVAVVLGQVALIGEARGARPLVLVDDLASELDPGALQRFLAALKACGSQSIVTSVSEEAIDRSGWDDARLFHVEQGAVHRMV
jgi:DNA replication and repair protein RecF